MSEIAGGLAPVPLRRDALVMAVVGFAHLVSHFFQLLLAPLFPWLREAFALSFAELGFVMSVLFTVSALGQAAAGFVVDRWGAIVTLVGGLACLVAGALVLALSGGYGTLLVSAVLVGLGNAVFHPVDYWLINHRISEPRLGPAYAVHGVTGSLGWALAPVFLVGIALAADWRTAAALAALLPLAAIAALYASRDGLLRGARPGADAAAAPGTAAPPFAFLRLPAIWLCLAFFACVAAALGGVQAFAPTVFGEGYGMALETAAFGVTLYMLGSAAGMLGGGVLAARSPALEHNITLALALAAAAALLVGSLRVPAAMALALMVVMGFGSGLSGPSRDLLIRRATPPGATGRVYGVVYSGLDLGLAIGPVLFGHMLDGGARGAVFFAIAGCFGGGVLLARRVAGAAAPLQAGAAADATQTTESREEAS